MGAARGDDATLASMRPPEFTGGNQDFRPDATAQDLPASMRPPEFTGGNQLEQRAVLPSLAGLQ